MSRAKSAGWILVGLTTVLSGCGRIVGNGDYALGSAGSRDTGGDTDDAGADIAPGNPGDARSDASADNDGSSDASARPDSSTGRDAGALADAVDGEEADLVFDGAAADDGPPLCGQSLLTAASGFDRVVRACVLAVSCDPIIFEGSPLSFCISHNYLSSNGTFACLTTIQDCEGFFRCVGRRAPVAADCPSTAPSARCDTASNQAIDCNAKIVKDCTILGGTCGTYSDTAGTMHAGCVVVPSCVETDGLAHCATNGRSLYKCQRGVGFGNDCTLENATCNSFGGDTTCYFDGPACTTPGYACNGGTLTECAPSSNRQFNYDCAAEGFSCATTTDGGAGGCMAPGCASYATCPAVESCGADGKTLTVCAGGAPYAIDCTKQGFAQCGTFADSAGNVYGYCL